MPRSNRPRGGDRRRPAPPSADEPPRLLHGSRRSETRRGRTWTVQPITATAALKTYVCPGCGGDIPVATPHVVVWRQDGVLGDDADLAARRHWHEHCWRIG